MVHKEWLKRAARNLRSAKTLLADGDYQMAAYLAQQCGEVALKGFLVRNSIELQKTHDLVKLVEACSKFNSSFPIIYEAALELTPYALKTRYPDNYIEVNEAMVDSAIKQATFILKFVRQQFNLVG